MIRWIPFAILAYAAMVAQTSVAHLVTFSAGSAGTISPDLLAMTAVFVAMYARAELDVMLAAWGLGLAMDLTTAQAVGVMPLMYALAAAFVFRLREAVFRERILTQVVLAMLFCLPAHGLWVTVQAALAWRDTTWGDWGRSLLQAVLIASYTAALMPLVHWALAKLQPLFLAAPAGRGRR